MLELYSPPLLLLLLMFPIFNFKYSFNFIFIILFNFRSHYFFSIGIFGVIRFWWNLPPYTSIKNPNFIYSLQETDKFPSRFLLHDYNILWYKFPFNFKKNDESSNPSLEHLREKSTSFSLSIHNLLFIHSPILKYSLLISFLLVNNMLKFTR